MARPKKVKREISDQDRLLLEEGWNDIGKSIAKTICETGKSVTWGWSLINMLGLYKRWMLTEWIKRYEMENPRESPDGRKRTLDDLRQKLRQEIDKTVIQEHKNRYDKQS